MRLFFVAASRDQADGCRVYRMVAPATALSMRGHKVHLNSRFVSKGKTLERGWDVVIAQRVARPNALREVQRLVNTKGGPKVLVELDDLLTHIDLTNTHAWNFYTKPDVQHALVEAVRVADGVICSTAPLRDEVLELGAKRAWVFENCVDETTLAKHPSAPGSPDGVVLGWGGGYSHERDIAKLSYGVSKTMQRHPETILHLIGADYRHAILGRSRARKMTERIRLSEWTETVTDYVTSLGLFDIGMAPLQPSRFNRSKSHLKPLEYASQGVPVVATDFGPYAEFVEHGVTGLLATSEHEWADHLEALVTDVELRKQMGEAGIELAREWTYQKRIDRYETILEEALDS